MFARRLALAATLALLMTQPALAQQPPASLGMPTDPERLSMQCAAAVAMESYLVEKVGQAPRFDQTAVKASMDLWGGDFARRRGTTLAGLADHEDFVGLAMSLGQDDQFETRGRQVRWCLANPPRR
ncbi:MAG: hypothetical protein ACK4RV_09035 [Caulobacter sp.]|jgi:hypothetical protein